MLILKAFYRHLPIFLNLFKCPLRGSICSLSYLKLPLLPLLVNLIPKLQNKIKPETIIIIYF
jgi:hypothetical protein